METNRQIISTRDPKGPTYSSVAPNSIHEFVWEDKGLTLRELIINYNLPLTVKLKASDIRKCFADATCGKCTCKDSNPTGSKVVHSCSSKGASEIKLSANLDLKSASLLKLLEISDTVRGKNKQRDLVLHIDEIVRKKIILGRKMTWDRRQNDYVVTGGQMEIPASVRGWLEVLPENGRPMEYYDTIDGIASLKPKRFLVRTSTVGYQLSTGDSGNCCWMPWEIKPGEVLTTGIIYVDSKKNKSAQKSFLRKLWKQENAKKEEDVKYLQCFDPSGSEIMIPLFMSGVFSPIGDSSFANYDAVYEFQDLIMAFGLPVNAQLIYANATESVPCLSGVIRLYGTREEEVVVMSKVGFDGELFLNNLDTDKFEMSLDNGMLFSRGVMRKKTDKHSKTVNGHVSLDEEAKLAKCKAEESKMKTKENIPNKPMKNCTVKSDQRISTSVYETAKHVTTDSLPCKMETNVDHKNISLPTRTVTKPEFDATARELQTSPSRLDSTLSPEYLPSRGVELPEKAAKEPKSKPSYILEKLSVRKVKKARAKLKELRTEDVFSKRLSKSELSYHDFYQDLEQERKLRRNSDYRISLQDSSRPSSRDETYKTISSNTDSGAYSTSTSPKTSSTYVSNTSLLMQRRANMQKRELPPVPLESSDNSNLPLQNDSTNLSKESEYEHLPQAPQLPHFRRASDSAILDSEYSRNNANAKEYAGDDDYMLPVQMLQESRYVKRLDFQPYHKPQAPVKTNVLAKGTSSREAYNESSGNSQWRGGDLDRTCPLDIDDLFNLTYSPKEKQHKSHVGASARTLVDSSRQVPRAASVPEWTLKLADNEAYLEQSFLDNLNIETRSPSCASRHKVRYSKHASINPNATLRAHNLRNIFPNVREVFSHNDSQPARRVFDNAHNHIQNCSHQHVCSCSPHESLPGNRSADNTMLQPFHHHLHHFHDNNYGIHYSETNSNFHPSSGAYFVGDFRDSFNQGDDSAISACSRGDVRYINDSVYNIINSGEQNVQDDDGWLPPNKIEELSVHEVSKSLRYIGMKDRVVLRFSKEQIDGSMLCTLDENLLKEGFPELNALEVKKILDFIRGWRPKKS
ncbi:hypothetical protein BsWGS_02769 [Bradybaena similaris]